MHRCKYSLRSLANVRSSPLLESFAYILIRIVPLFTKLYTVTINCTIVIATIITIIIITRLITIRFLLKSLLYAIIFHLKEVIKTIGKNFKLFLAYLLPSFYIIPSR